MDILQIILTAGALSVLALIIGLFIQSKVDANNSTAITKEVVDQIVEQINNTPQQSPTQDTVAKPKKKTKYYPRKPKTKA